MQLLDVGVIFNIKSIRVKISISFLIFFGISFFSPYAKEFCALIVSLGIHELSHIIAADALMVKVSEIIFLPIGGKIKLDKTKNISYMEEIILSMAGPFGNLLVFIFLFALKQKLPMWEEYIDLLASKQLSIALFNLLPAFPLDGGRIFLMWLFQNLNIILSINFAALISLIISLALILFGAILYFSGLLSPFYFVFGFFLLLTALKEKKDLPFMVIYDFLNIKKRFSDSDFWKVKYIAVKEEFLIKDILKLVDPKSYIILVVIDGQGKIRKFLTESEIFDNMIKKGLDLKIGQI
ncbi:site-2 protease family protein [Thermovenabulum sp.]|uniref:site-2 protease family protein n=1 Tax=Thermovenabulum sp. TaxID=3100335 RepID=UPI003C7BE44A